jgi:sRNA-binding carbon storage regulator CsrA
MLILTRYPGETVEMIAQAPATIKVTVIEVFSNGVVKLGFDGPQHVQFIRDNAIRRRPPKEHGDETRNPCNKIDGERLDGRIAFQDDPDEPDGNR